MLKECAHGEFPNTALKETKMDKPKADEQAGQVQGEGDYEAARDYNQRTRRFVDSGRVESAAREAEPTTEEEAAELEQAEEIGKRHAKENAPANTADTRNSDDSK
jgi:hypothetical protein